MAEVYVSLITKGLMTINEVPMQIKEDVKAILIRNVYNDLAQERE